MPKPYMTRAEYARYRGVNQGQITKYGRQGLLVEGPDGRIDVAATDARLDAVLNPVHGGDRRAEQSVEAAHDGPGRIAYLEAKAEETRLKALARRLELEERAGRLVRADEVEAEAFARARQAQEAILALPDRLASQLAAETDEARVYALLEAEVRRIARELAASAAVEPAEASAPAATGKGG